MEIETTRFGKLKIDDSKIIFFPSGVLGFPTAKRYVLIPLTDDSPFLWLQAVDIPDLAFLVVFPKEIFEDYDPQIPLETLKDLHVQNGDELEILGIVTVPSNRPQEMTVNLMGPIIVNVDKKLAKQIVLDQNYPLKQP
ncbi:MAG: flagellar assembly protein FliW, partial [Thermodesulfobacteria bacterium]|nr:flagellar assembly protein FliW [Thermodesulfobacteriota bacterium]